MTCFKGLRLFLISILSLKEIKLETHDLLQGITTISSFRWLKPPLKLETHDLLQGITTKTLITIIINFIKLETHDLLQGITTLRLSPILPY